MKNLFALLRLSKPLHGLMIALTLLLVVGTLFELVTPLLSGKILDEVIQQVGAEDKVYTELIRLISISLFSTLVYLVIRSVGQRLGDHLGGHLRKHLTEIFYKKALSLPQSYYDSEMSGKILSQLSRGIVSIQGFVNVSTNFIIPTFLQGVIVIGILIYYNLALGLLMVAIIPIYTAISRYSTKRWGKREEKKNKIEDQSRSRIQESISNIRLVKSYTNEPKEYGLVSGYLAGINKIIWKQSNEYHAIDFVRETSLYLVLFATSLIIFYNALIGVITVGTVIVLMQLVERARYPLFGMSYILEQIQAIESGSKEFIEIINLPTSEDFDGNEKVKLVEKPEIRFDKVSFKYDTSEKVLDKVSFSIGHNEMVALVGPSGAGKTTIANLLLKLYEPTEGEIYLNDQQYSKLSHKFVRENIALVFQASELFSTTIKENVAYGSKLDDDKVVDALKKANAWEFVSNLKGGINAEVGERGIRLSGGQKQRIQVARAIYKDAPILILDEATSSLDAKSESEVSEAVDRLVEGRMVIVIAHRFSTIQNANKVIVLNNKGIEAIGNPQELSTKPGIYADLLQYQIEGNKKLLKKFELA
ncbi:MAG: ABC transporter ATP-binding protein [Candidatus Dojkabacteria bacterium]|nr:MAG: ABC transporter ATP-binding protein [Candidatus Dojkabacteria bacterium]